METLSTIGGFAVLLTLALMPPLTAALLTWATVLRGRPLSSEGTVVIFLVSAFFAIGAYGHAGILPAVLLMLIAGPEGKSAAAVAMLVAAVPITSAVWWWSHRSRPR